jgi:hypothetical protein
LPNHCARCQCPEGLKPHTLLSLVAKPVAACLGSRNPISVAVAVVACQGAKILFPVAVNNVTHPSLTVAAVVIDKSMIKLSYNRVLDLLNEDLDKDATGDGKEEGDDINLSLNVPTLSRNKVNLGKFAETKVRVFFHNL